MLHFTETEFARRRSATNQAMEDAGLDALLLFAPESQYWLTGFDTFGYCFFQCLIWDGERTVLLTRSADMRQAQMTSNIGDIRVWMDGAEANPAMDLRALLAELGLSGKRLGVEWDTHGLTAFNGQKLSAALAGERLTDASLTDDALDAALAVTCPGGGEAEVFAAMHDVIFRGGGGYPGNPFIVGGGEHALLCRTQAGRGTFAQNDQLTLEWSAAMKHYHAAAKRTVIIGEPRPEHPAMFQAARDALLACEAALLAAHRLSQTLGPSR